MSAENTEIRFQPSQEELDMLFRLRKRPIDIKTAVRFQDPFPPEVTRIAIAKAFDRGVLPGPIDLDSFRHPVLTMWEGSWSLAIALASTLPYIDAKFQECFKQALRHNRPSLYFLHTKPPIGLFVHIDNIGIAESTIPDAKTMVPLLMGDSWAEVPNTERFDYWSTDNPPAVGRFLADNTIYMLRAQSGVSLTAEEVNKMYEIGNDNSIGECVDRVLNEQKANTPEGRYIDHLINRGVFRLRQKNPWVKGSEWRTQYKGDIIQFLQEDFLPQLINQEQTITFAFSAPKD